MICAWHGCADADPRDLVLVPNATAGLSAVLQAAPKLLQPGQRILKLSQGYGSVSKMLRLTGFPVDEVAVPFPVTAEQLLSLVDAAITPQTRLAVFDAVTSNSALALPLQQLVERFNKRYNMPGA